MLLEENMTPGLTAAQIDKVDRIDTLPLAAESLNVPEMRAATVLEGHDLPKAVTNDQSSCCHSEMQDSLTLCVSKRDVKAGVVHVGAPHRNEFTACRQSAHCFKCVGTRWPGGQVCATCTRAWPDWTPRVPQE